VIAFAPTPSPSLTIERVHPQLDQFITSYVRVMGHEPSADEIADFEARHGLTPLSRGDSPLSALGGSFGTQDCRPLHSPHAPEP
jgi:hypothetical protein